MDFHVCVCGFSLVWQCIWLSVAVDLGAFLYGFADNFACLVYRFSVEFASFSVHITCLFCGCAVGFQRFFSRISVDLL